MVGGITAFELVNEARVEDSRILLVCDHASCALPTAAFDKRVEGFVADEAELKRHIGVDIGAADVCRGLAEMLGAPAILAGYSRLYVDLNRAVGDFTSMRAISDGTVIEGNRCLTAEEKRVREEALFHPYHRQIDKMRAGMVERLTAEGRGSRGADSLAVLFVHSFAPIYKGEMRPWHVGVLSGVKDKRLAHGFLGCWRQRFPDSPIGDNEPYSGELNYSYSIHRHAEDPGHMHFGLEIRHDLIDTPDKAALWTTKTAKCVKISLQP